jgi:hypothetical protein
MLKKSQTIVSWISFKNNQVLEVNLLHFFIENSLLNYGIPAVLQAKERTSNIADLKGLNHENFGSEFPTPLEAYLGGRLRGLKEKNSFWTFDAPAYGVFSANIVLSASSACAYCFQAHARHAFNGFKRMLSMLLTLFSACL